MERDSVGFDESENKPARIMARRWKNRVEDRGGGSGGGREKKAPFTALPPATTALSIDRVFTRS